MFSHFNVFSSVLAIKELKQVLKLFPSMQTARAKAMDNVKDIRNVTIIAHVDNGKTTLRALLLVLVKHTLEHTGMIAAYGTIS
jgi:hypothetical protein